MGVKIGERRGSWYVFVNHQKRRVARCLGKGKVGKKAAEDAAVQIAARLAIGDGSVLEKQTAPVAVSTFKEIAEAYPTWAQGVFPVRPSTAKSRESFTRVHLIPYFGAKPITDVTRASIQSFIAALRAGGLADSAIRVGLVTLGLVLSYAVERGDLSANPMRIGARLWKAAEPDPPDPFTRSELSELLLAADVIDPRWGTMLSVWAATGMRSGELRGLQGADLVDGSLKVGRTLSKGHTGAPKTSRSVRTVPLPAALLSQVIAQAPPDPTAPMFSSVTRPGRMHEAELHRLWRRTLATSGVRPRVPENLRHTNTSIRLSDGEPLLKVAAEIGDAPATLLKYYARYLAQVSGSPAQPSGPAVKGMADLTPSRKG